MLVRYGPREWRPRRFPRSPAPGYPTGDNEAQHDQGQSRGVLCNEQVRSLQKLRQRSGSGRLDAQANHSRDASVAVLATRGRHAQNPVAAALYRHEQQEHVPQEPGHSADSAQEERGRTHVTSHQFSLEAKLSSPGSDSGSTLPCCATVMHISSGL